MSQALDWMSSVAGEQIDDIPIIGIAKAGPLGLALEARAV